MIMHEKLFNTNNINFLTSLMKKKGRRKIQIITPN